ncbi:hypothetical protein ABSL23_13445 [Halobacterium sp. NMX12-1]|uniref:Uncharacterized protein n=2 Tax=Halobacterium sp. NMX12-1 TaxID=3166650 RepID=A0AAU8CDD3_9EURY
MNRFAGDMIQQYPAVRILSSGKGVDESGEEFTAVKVEGKLKNSTIDINGPGNSGIGVESEGGEFDNVSLDIDGFETNLKTEDTEGTISSLDSTDTDIGWKAKSGTDIEVGEINFETRIADIVYTHGVRIEFIDEVANQIYRETSGSLKPAEIELHSQAKAVLDSESEEEKRKKFAQLLKNGYRGIDAFLNVYTAYKLVQIYTDFGGSSVPNLLPY